ncbi:MAG: hypothetical protein IM613_17460 [Cytophagales bacterium]|nr:hypothetical protein [Cytophagales bacterium]
MMTTTSASKLEILKEGFLIDREECNNHVLTIGTRTGWGSDSVLSTYITKEPPMDRQLKEAIKLCRQRAIAMRKDSTPRVTVTFIPNRSCTDGARVFVASEVFDEKSYSFHEKLDVVLGLTTHEMAHVLYTDFHYVKEAGKHGKLMKTIQNIIEDERIERRVSMEMAGFSRYLRSAKKYYFDFLYKQKEVLSVGTTGQAFDVFFKLVRYPSNLAETDLQNVFEVSMKVKEILTPYPVTDRDVLAASKAIFELLKGTAKEQEEQGGGSVEGNSILQKLGDAMGETLDSVSDSIPSDDGGEETAGATSAAPLQNRMAKLLQDEIQRTLIEDGAVKSVPVEHEGTGTEMPVVYINPEKDRTAYMDKFANVRSQAAQLARVLSIERFQSNVKEVGLREGQLDEHKLVDAVAGIETVYTNRRDSNKKPMCVVLLIDRSGSMSGEKIAKAAEVAILFAEALRKLPNVELFIYGFNSDAGYPTRYHEVTVYHEPNNRNHFALGAMESGCGNADGICMRSVGERVRNQTPSKGIFFVVSDGHPASSAYASREQGIEDTRAAVEYLEKLSFHPVQIGIDVKEETQALMFSDFVNYDGAGSMVKGIGKLLRKKMAKFAKR